MSKLDEIILHLAAGAMEYQNPGSVTVYGSATAIGPQTAKQQIKDLIRELIGDVEQRETEDMSLNSWTPEDYKAFGKNELKIELRRRVYEL